MNTESVFLKELVKQIRAIDTYGVWDKISDEELLTKKYVKTKEQLKEIPVIADIDKEQIYIVLVLCYKVLVML